MHLRRISEFQADDSDDLETHSGNADEFSRKGGQEPNVLLNLVEALSARASEADVCKLVLLETNRLEKRRQVSARWDVK